MRPAALSRGRPGYKLRAWIAIAMSRLVMQAGRGGNG